MWKVTLIVASPQRTVIQLCSSLHGPFKHLSAHCFSFLAHNLTVLVHSHSSHQHHFWPQQAAEPCTKWQAAMGTNQLVNIVAAWASKEPDSFRSWWRPKIGKEIDYWTWHQQLELQIQMIHSSWRPLSALPHDLPASSLSDKDTRCHKIEKIIIREPLAPGSHTIITLLLFALFMGFFSFCLWHSAYLHSFRALKSWKLNAKSH